MLWPETEERRAEETALSTVGAGNITCLSGDVNRLVAKDTAGKIYWEAYKSWPDHKIEEARVTFRLYAWPKHNLPDYQVLDLKSGAVEWYVEAECRSGYRYVNWPPSREDQHMGARLCWTVE